MIEKIIYDGTNMSGGSGKTRPKPTKPTDQEPTPQPEQDENDESNTDRC